LRQQAICDEASGADGLNSPFGAIEKTAAIPRSLDARFDAEKSDKKPVD